MNDAKNLQEVLSKISDLIASVIDIDSHAHGEHAGIHSDTGCLIKSLPVRLIEKGAMYACEVNPQNAVNLGPVAMLSEPGMVTKAMIAVLTSKYWGPSSRTLTVSFMQSTSPDLRARILQHMNAWAVSAGVAFTETTGIGDVRISFGPGGYWSYLGTDIKLIPADQPTMNLEGFSMDTPESEYLRVVRHETGHTLGFPHEHMRRELVERIDPDKAYAYFLANYGWPRDVVDQQVLTPLDDRSLFATPADQTSIMCYQLPGSITVDGQPIVGGTDINLTDYAFAAAIYPKVLQQNRVAPSAKPSAKADAAKGSDQKGSWPHIHFAQDWGAAKDPELPL